MVPPGLAAAWGCAPSRDALIDAKYLMPCIEQLQPKVSANLAAGTGDEDVQNQTLLV
jgi:hypothetical protein